MARPGMRFRGPVFDAEVDGAVDLAMFYAALLDWEVTHQYDGENGTWALVESPSRRLKIEFQGLADYRRPIWPNTNDEQQMMMHLDIAVEDVSAAVEWAVEQGATVADHQPQLGNRVMLDPAGHPFCFFPGDVE